MKGFLTKTWGQICNLITFSSPQNTASLRNKAIAVAGRVTIKTDKECSKVSCPVCFNVLQAKLDSDLRMTLAVHMSLWHPDDVKLQWEIMHNKKNQSISRLPSIIIGVGMAAVLGALFAQHLPAKRRSLGEEHRLLQSKARGYQSSVRRSPTTRNC